MSSPAQPVILAFETAGMTCSVAVGIGGKLAGAERVASMHGQAEILLPLVDKVMSAAGFTTNSLDVVAVTVGPGSFTGIRIGLAAASGIARATAAQLFGVSSFDAVAAAVPRCDGDSFLLIALESRREELYVQLYDPSRNPVDQAAAIMPAALAEAVSAVIGQRPVLIAGDAAHRAGLAVARTADALVLEGAAPDATGVLAAALSQIRSGKRGAAARPFYLRPPDVTLPGRRPSAALA
jgi:tRNA threonylcarbamoyladenosine biosynthesis protein TsaB